MTGCLHMGHSAVDKVMRELQHFSQTHTWPHGRNMRDRTPSRQITHSMLQWTTDCSEKSSCISKPFMAGSSVIVCLWNLGCCCQARISESEGSYTSPMITFSGCDCDPRLVEGAARVAAIGNKSAAVRKLGAEGAGGGIGGRLRETRILA